MNLKYIFLSCLLSVAIISGCRLNENINIPGSTQSDNLYLDSDTRKESESSSQTTVRDQTENISESSEKTPEGSQEPIPSVEPEDDDLVRVIDYIPFVYQELAYATGNNFTKQQVYTFTDAYLRYGTVKKLLNAALQLAEQGLYIKMWDAFRPVSAQEKLWQICPDPTYVSHPVTGNRTHCRGSAVDITLVDEDGKELEMPSGFDDFSPAADLDYSDVSEIAAVNAKLLQDTMEKYGFKGYSKEWWHFSDSVSYPVEESFEPVDVSVYYAYCNEFISLRTKPDVTACVITRIPADCQFQLMAVDGDFCLVNYEGAVGYVLKSYIRPMGAE